MDKSPNWDSAWSQINFDTLAPLEVGMFSQLIDWAVPVVESGSKSAIEIGCFPGRFIEYVGRKGYVISGVDNYARVGEITQWAVKYGHMVGRFHQDTLSGFVSNTRETFDVVLSLGFIEHFHDFCDVLYSHLQLCTIGGRVVIGAPNFASPVQRALHHVLDNSNITSHVLTAMYPSVWATYLSALGVRIDFAGPLGGFAFWSDSDQENSRIQLLQKVVPQLSGTMRQMSPKFNERESSYLATIGTKTRSLPPYNEAIELSKHCLKLASELSDRDQRIAQPCINFLTELCSHV